MGRPEHAVRHAAAPATMPAAPDSSRPVVGPQRPLPLPGLAVTGTGTRVGGVNDPAEVEAERLAHSVLHALRSPEATDVVRTPRTIGIETLRRAPAVSGPVGPAGGTLGPAHDALLTSSAGRGSAIAAHDRARLEPLLRADLSTVRLHSDATAAGLTQAMGASALTYGKDIYFRDGLPDTRREEGMHLLAHEVAHTLQSDRENGTSIRRMVNVVSATGERENILKTLPRFGIRMPKDHREWYRTSIYGSGQLRGRFGYVRFAGYMSGRHDLTINVSQALKDVTFNEFNVAVASAINTQLLATMIERGNSSIGEIKTVKRTAFPAAIKSSFDKTAVIRAIAKEGGGQHEGREIHLRHLVMGSWFRALPTLLNEADLNDNERAQLRDRIAALIPRVAPLAGEPKLAAANTLDDNANLLALLLHNLLPNLNAGEGQENVLIGFLSHGLSNLAEEVRTSGAAIAAADAGALIEEAVSRVTLVAPQERMRFEQDHQPTQAFRVILNEHIGDAAAVEPDQLSTALHELAYNLGMDLLKREAGKPKSMAHVSLLVAQRALLPVGDALYGLIRFAQQRRLDPVQVAKLVLAIEHAVSLFEHALAPPARVFDGPLPPRGSSGGPPGDHKGGPEAMDVDD